MAGPKDISLVHFIDDEASDTILRSNQEVQTAVEVDANVSKGQSHLWRRNGTKISFLIGNLNIDRF